MSFDAAAGGCKAPASCVPCIKYPVSGSQGCGPETGYLRKFINILSANSCGQAGS